MAAEPTDTIGTYLFMLDIGGKEAAGYFRECTGLTSEHTVVEDKAADATGRTIVRKIPGQMTWSNITLKRGIDTDMQLWNWRKDIIDGKINESRMDCTITAYDWQMEAVLSFSVKRAWPCRYGAPGLNAGGNEVLVEEIELAHEGFERVEV